MYVHRHMLRRLAIKKRTKKKEKNTFEITCATLYLSFSFAYTTVRVFSVNYSESEIL